MNWTSSLCGLAMVLSVAGVPAQQPPPPADRPLPRTDANSMTAHDDLVRKKAQGRIDVYFIGDSIVRRWGATDYPDLLKNWTANFFGWNAADFGWGADRTENILWRLENDELDGVNPKVIVVLAGTNNVGSRPGDEAKIADVTRGLEAILDVCRKKAPGAVVILTAIFPRNDNIAVMPEITRINQNLARLADGRKVRYLSVNDKLADRDGRLFDGVMNANDKLHPTLEGYQVWADGLKPILTEILGPPATTDHAPPPTGDPSAAGRAQAARPAVFTDWPARSSPSEIGARVAENFVVRPFQRLGGFVTYQDVCGWYGALTFASLTRNAGLQERLVRRFEPLLAPEGAKSISPEAHVDYRVFGAVPLELYIQTKDRRFLDLGLGLADRQWETTTPDGITTEARYWIDDMFMITALQVQAYRATGDRRYVDRTAVAMVAYLDRLQQPNGLFFHAPDARFYWGRGNGWMAAGSAELLRSLPGTHPSRPRILEGYRRMMASLLRMQGDDGLWRQLLDRPESWPETSSTGMFAFAMATGVKHGWLDPQTYGPAVRRAWLGLVQYLDADANLSNVCTGTPKGETIQYYLDRPRIVGDLHGQAALLWTASALLR